jgi:type VI secretion system protein ImpJ
VALASRDDSRLKVRRRPTPSTVAGQPEIAYAEVKTALAMKNLPVHWYEGQFLHPHHFQAADRYWAELAATSQQWDHPYNYGLHEIDRAVVGNLFRVDKLKARMRDGTLVDWENKNKPLTADLEKALHAQPNEPIRIFLGIPKSRDAQGASSSETPPGIARVDREFDDENRADGRRKIRCRELVVRLLLETEHRADFEALPIAQVKRGTGNQTGPQLDDAYIPPVLSTNAWEPLGNGMVREVHDWLVQHLNDLEVKLRGVKLRDQILEVSKSVWFALMDRLYEMSSALGVMVPAAGVHPFTAYVELCRIAGKLAIFGDRKPVLPLPQYDHEKLQPTFSAVKRLIRTFLDSIQGDELLRRNFVWEDGMMQARLDSEWFNPRVEWFIGVDRGKTLSDDECRRLLSAQNNFIWKFGSIQGNIYTGAGYGLQLDEVVNPIPELPPHQYWTFWRVQKEPVAIYSSIERTHTVIAFMKRSSNLSIQSDPYAGSSHFPVMRNGKEIDLGLTIFGLPR